MDERKFQLGQTVYSAQNFKIGRYVVAQYVTTQTTEGTTFEYVIVDYADRKTGYSEEDISNYFFETIEEARVLSAQNWEIESKKIVEQIKTIDDGVFDDIAKRYKEKQEQRKTNA